MKILVYAFKSYVHWKKNITEQVLENINNQKNIVKIVFPQKFNRKMISKAVKEIRPDMIIGLGQCEDGELLRIERKAYNYKKLNEKKQKVAILIDHPNHYFLNLYLKDDENSWHSYYAGDDVTNNSMYLIAHLFKNIHFAFINIPKDYDQKKAAEFVEKKIAESCKEFNIIGEQSGLTNFKNTKEVNSSLLKF